MGENTGKINKETLSNEVIRLVRDIDRLLKATADFKSAKDKGALGRKMVKLESCANSLTRLYNDLERRREKNPGLDEQFKLDQNVEYLGKKILEARTRIDDFRSWYFKSYHIVNPGDWTATGIKRRPWD